MKYQKLISKMTLEEKCYLFSGKDFWQSRSVERLGIPNMAMADGPHGIRKQVGAGDQLGLNGSVPATCFPTAAAIANSWNPELGEEIGRCLGEEASCQDVDVLLGPGMNIKRSPLCGRNFEYFSEDPYLTGKMAAGYIRGIQSFGVSACPKHFAANSQELRRMASDSVVDERTLQEIYLTAFEIAVKEADPHAVMSSYNRINGIYANENKHLLRDILKDEWGFHGFVISDWGGSNDHTAGVSAGSHLEMPTTGGDSDLELLEAVRAGRISEKWIDQMADELLDVIFSTTKEVSKKRGQKFDIEKHHAMAEKASEQSAVLLKNEGNILPLKKGTKVALIGDFAENPRYQGAGSSVVNPTRLDSAAGVIQKFDLECIGFARGYHRVGPADTALEREACGLAKGAEAVLLYIGLDEISESEGLDRQHMRIPESQIRLLEKIYEVNKNIVAVFSAGSAVEMPETAQLYVSARCKGEAAGKELLQKGMVYRPAKELKWFQKVFLKAGESRRVTILLDDKAFRYFNGKTNRFETEGGEYDILIGASVADIRLSGTVSVKGTDAPFPYQADKMKNYYSGNIKNISDLEFTELLGHGIPDGNWHGTLDINDAICQMYYAKSGIARFVYSILTKMLKKAEAKGKPDLNLLFIYNMPFRGIAKMTGGMVTMEMAEGILSAVNGHFFKGLGRIIGGFFHSGAKKKKAKQMH